MLNGGIGNGSGKMVSWVVWVIVFVVCWGSVINRLFCLIIKGVFSIEGVFIVICCEQFCCFSLQFSIFCCLFYGVIIR